MSGPVDLLLVEDNPADALLVEEVVSEGPTQVRVHVTVDGEAALAFLARCPAGMLPKLVLLDWNLPRSSGREVLASLKSNATSPCATCPPTRA